MATLVQLKKRATFYGATVVDEKIGNAHECRVEAPHRKRWVEGSVHEMVDTTNIPWKPDYADLLSRMNFGLEDCVGDCDWCDEEGA
jgi:hypothetical protein